MRPAEAARPAAVNREPRRFDDLLGGKIETEAKPPAKTLQERRGTIRAELSGSDTCCAAGKPRPQFSRPDRKAVRSPERGRRAVTVAARKLAARPIPAIEVFELRAWARAYLWSIGEYSLHEAVDVLQHDAVRTGLVAAIGQDQVQRILADTFVNVRLEKIAEDGE